MKKPNALEDPLGTFGEFLTDSLGPVFDYFEGKSKLTKTEKTESEELNDSGNGSNGNGKQPEDKRGTGSTFTAAAKSKAKGKTVDSGASATGGNDGGSVQTENGKTTEE